MKKFKGFTLIECLIAMFILGIASLLLCQGYTQLMKITSRTARVNASLAHQTQLAEKGKAPDGTNVKRIAGNSEADKNKYDLKIKYQDTSTYSNSNRKYIPSSGTYDCKVSVFAVSGKYRSNGSMATYSYGNTYASSDNKDGSEMRYAYFYHE